MGGNALNSIGIETERKSTKDLFRIFNEIKDYFVDYEITMTKFYANKETHGDLDILVKSKDVDGLIELVNEKIKPNGLIVNDDAISFDYDNFQVDLICIEPSIWDTAVIYYSYDPFGNLAGKIAKGFGLRYGKDGLYYLIGGKRGSKKVMLSTDNEEIFNFLGYSFSEFKKGFKTTEDIFLYIIRGKYFDKKLFDPKNLTSNDRKRSLKRPSFNSFLEYTGDIKSTYNFKEKDSYVDYIDSWFPGFKKEVKKYKQNDEMKVYINKKLRQVIENFKNGKFLGDVIFYYKLIKDDYENYILNTDIEDIVNDFGDFYRRCMELDRMMDKDFGFGKKMGNDIYIHRNYESYLPQDVLSKARKLLPKGFNYTILKWNKKDNSISFIESSDFDTANEPTVDSSYKVSSDGVVKFRAKPKRDQIYHHKWMFVQPSYTGFDYQESKVRSLNWYKKYDYDSKMIGYKDYWDSLNISESYTEEEIDIANKTSRTSKNPGAVGGMAVVPEFVEKLACKSDLILDFGAGKYPLHALRLKNKGYKVKSYDFGKNFNVSFHDKDALDYKYNIVYASNVLNVQSNEDMFRRTIEQIIGLMKDESIFVANYPASPRKMGASMNDIKEILSDYFTITNLGKQTMLMRPKKPQIDMQNESRVVGNFESFSMVIKNHDILKNDSDYNQYGTKEIKWDNILNKPVNDTKYIKPYEKGNLY